MLERKSLTVVMLVMFLTMTGFGIVLPSLPYLAERLHLSSFQMGSLITGWALAQFLITPIWGRVIDRFGKKQVLLIGMLSFGITLIMTPFMPTYLPLIIIRIIGSSLAAGSIPAALTIVAESSVPELRSALIAKMGAVNSLGFLCGPVIGGILLPLGVNAPFLGGGIISLCILPFIWIYIKEPKMKQSQLMEKELSFFQSISMVSKVGYRELFIPSFGQSLAASSLLGMLGYFMIDKFSAHPWQVSLGFSVFAAGSAIVQFFLLPLIYQKKPDNWIAKFGFCISALGYAGIALAPIPMLVILACGVSGVGMAFVRPTILSLLSKQEHMGRGITMALDQSMDSLGRVLGPLLGGVIYSLHSSLPFYVSAIVCLCMLLMINSSSRNLKGAWSMPKQKVFKG